MPKMDLTISQGALSGEAKAELPGKLAEALLRWEGAPDTDFFRSISWMHVHELPADATHSANGPTDESRAIVEVTTPQGALSDRRRAGLAEELTGLILEATGWGDEAKLRIWVMCREIDEGSWAAAGQIVHFEQLRQAAKAEQESPGTGREEVIATEKEPVA
jgi:phenylpyruvate tautomerase PptA (4-oxalocrotonate tautomerase family)